MKIGVTANLLKPLTRQMLRRLGAEAGRLGFEVEADREIADLISESVKVRSDSGFTDLDVLVVLGGDGTLLKSVRDLNGLPIPVLGVNCGSLGFLTSVASEDLERALQSLASGDYRVGVRSTADCRVIRNQRQTGRFQALNDLVISNAGKARMATLHLSIDEQDVADFLCDGLILATPTGSTGHALSAGGPIIEPASPVFVVCPICCHTLSTRPLVVSDRRKLVVDIVQATSGGMWLAVDGQTGGELSAGDQLVFQRGDVNVSLIHLPGSRYFDVLRQKLHWRGSNI